MVRKNLRQDGEVIDSLSRLANLKEQLGEKPGKTMGSTGGLKNTLKKMKPTGKKKRQRNITAPELSVEALRDLNKEQGQKAGKEGGKEGGRWLFGRSKEKESPPQKKPEHEAMKRSPELRRTTVPSIKEEDQRALESFSSTDDMSLSQKSEPRLSEFHLTTRDRAATLPNLSRSRTDTNINYHQDLSQISLSPSIPEETFSTQSSFEAVPLEQLAPPSHGHREAGSGGSQSGSKLSPNSSVMEDGLAEKVEGEERGEEREAGEEEWARYFQKGCPSLYEDYGDEQHKLNLKHVMKFLESCNETAPVDLGILQDWDGWSLSTKELV